STRTAHPRDLHSFPTRRSSDRDPLWRERLVRILAGSRTLYEHQDYERGEGSITIHPNVLEAGFQTISVQAEGYSGATVIQTVRPDRKSTRLNSSHVKISYAVFC